MGIARSYARRVSSSYILRVSAVSTGPGASAFTVTPVSAHSRAMTRVMVIIAPLVAPYAVRPVPPRIPEMEAIATMRP